MTWVKVCGLTRRQDVEAAVAAGADALGFVAVPSSPRAINFEQIADLVLNVEVPTILLVSDLAPQDVVAAALAIGVDGVQPYGHGAAEAARVAAEVGLFVIRPVPLDIDLSQVPDDQYPLFDHPAGGGSGLGFDHAWLPTTERKFILAGGLGPDNVVDTIRKVRPWGVDASSRLETRPGIKDPELITRFVSAAKEA